MEDDRQRDIDSLKRHCQLLSEHFDTVQIFATRHHSNGTINVNFGTGNWFARYGFVKLWTQQQESYDPREDDHG